MDALLRNWFDKDPVKIAAMSPGTSCDTWLVQTAQGRFVLRGQPSRQAADQEALISQVLQGTDLTAELLPARSGQFTLEKDGLFYNVQTFLEGTPADLSDPRQIQAAAETAAKMHKRLSQGACTLSTHDRFSSLKFLDISVPDGLFPDTVQTAPQRVTFITALERMLANTQCIHGDLGSWNMLWDQRTLRIIDFGESRTGDFHFDLAAILCGILAKCSSADLFLPRMLQCLDTYRRHGDAIDMEKVHICVYLWLLRGALAACAMDNAMTAQRAKFFAAEFQKYLCFTHWRLPA